MLLRSKSIVDCTSVKRESNDLEAATLAKNVEPLGLENVPRDAMNIVLSFVTFSDYCSLSLVSRKTRDGVSKASSLVMEEVMSGEPNSRDSSSMVVRLDDKSLRRLLQRYQNLDVLHLTGLAAVGDKLFTVLNDAEAATTIHSLSLNGVSLTYWCQDTLNLTNLEHLRIYGGSIRASLGCLFNGQSKKLQSVSIGQCSSLRDDQVKDIVKRLGDSLTSLSLTQCLRVKQPVIQFANLEQLNLMGCFALTDLPKISCPTLKKLDLSFCFRLNTERIQQTISALPMLEELTLVKCPALQSLTLESHTLRTLNVNFCSSLKTLKLACPNLQILQNTSCSSLESFHLAGGNSIREINLSTLPISILEIFACNLVRLNLSGCRKLDQCIVHCPKLEDVRLRGCRIVALRFCKEVREVSMSKWTHMPLEVQ